MKKEIEIFRPMEGDSFRFSCHRGISCFTECCAKLRLALTPYDIVRIKNRLGISSEEFIDRYTETSFKVYRRFPAVLLRMNPDSGNRCPFVTPEGCSIYEDRPGACRLYPVARASAAQGSKRVQEKFFLVMEPHCRGFEEDVHWTIEEWLSHEGLKEYNRMNDPWTEIVTSARYMGEEDTIPKKLQMFFMASYNLDRFRDFIFRSSFLSHFEVDKERIEKIEKEDAELMLFAFDWLKFSLFGDNTIVPVGS